MYVGMYVLEYVYMYVGLYPHISRNTEDTEMVKKRKKYNQDRKESLVTQVAEH